MSVTNSDRPVAMLVDGLLPAMRDDVKIDVCAWAVHAWPVSVGPPLEFQSVQTPHTDSPACTRTASDHRSAAPLHPSPARPRSATSRDSRIACATPSSPLPSPAASSPKTHRRFRGNASRRVS